MDNGDQELESRIRDRIRRFLRSDSRSREDVVRIIREIESQNWAAYFFGGFPRDLLLLSDVARPRDIDIVASLASPKEIEAVLGKWIAKKNRFGGYKLDVGMWEIDIWPAAETWALREHGLLFWGIGGVRATTFLNIEAVMVSVRPDSEGRRAVLSNGFFEACRTRCVDIAFGENPYPALCVLRAIRMAKRLDFCIGRKLMSYLVKRRHDVSVKEIMAAQIRHYGREVLTSAEIRSDWRMITHAFHEGASRVRLPASRFRQLLLWDEEPGDMEHLVAIGVRVPRTAWKRAPEVVGSRVA